MRAKAKHLVTRAAHAANKEVVALSKSTYEPTVLARSLALAGPIRTVVDVGASDGRWSGRLAQQIPGAEFLLVEANPVWHDALSGFAAGRPNMHPAPYAASDHEGTVSFYIDPANPLGGGASAVATTDHTATVPARPIDDLVAEANLAGPFMLKLDTQGHEVEVFAGAARTLNETSLIVVEAYGVGEPGRPDFSELLDHMRGLGFRCSGIADLVVRPSDGMLWQMDLALIPESHPALGDTNYH